MDKGSLYPGQDYAYRAKLRAWEKRVDPPLRATLLETLAPGRHRLRLDNGDEIEARSSQLVARWDQDEIHELLRAEDHSRAFSAETTHDQDSATAITLVLNTVSAGAYADDDRAWIPNSDAEAVQQAAEVRDDLMDLSPVAYRDRGLDVDEEGVYLPLPIAGQLARRIAERNPQAVVAAAAAGLERLRSREDRWLVEYYKPGWDKAVKWAGHTPTALPEPELNPADAHNQLWEKLRGRGVFKTGHEDHAWKVPEEMVMELAHLLAGAARYSGRLTIRPVQDGHVRLSLDWGHRRPVSTPDEIRGVALSLSRQQEAALGELRDAGSEGAAVADLRADPRTVESLVSRDLAEPVDTEHNRISVQVGLTDAGWRVLQHLVPRSL